MVVVLCFTTDDWQIHRLVRLLMLAKSLSGEEVATEVIQVLQVDYQVGITALLGCMQDRASVNSKAMTTVKVIFPEVFDVGCFSHIMDHVGDRFHCPALDVFVSAWIKLFSHSPKGTPCLVCSNWEKCQVLLQNKVVESKNYIQT